MYKFQAIDPRKPVVAPHTLGIEVTEPQVAALCDLGNIDEQHRHEGGRAACDVALSWSPPPAGATLATIRPDLDSVTAMAVFALRGVGLEYTQELRERVAAVAHADGFTRSAWSPRPLPTIGHPWCDVGPVEDRPDLAAANAVCFDRAMPLDMRVCVVAAWLLGGDEPSDDACAMAARAIGLERVAEGGAEHLRTILRLARQRVASEREAMLRSFTTRRMIPCPTDSYDLALAAAGAMTPATSTIREDRGIAVVESTYPGAIGMGYCLAPVVVARNRAFRWPTGGEGAKATVAFYVAPGAETMQSLADRLSREEAAALCDIADRMADGGGGCFVRLGPDGLDTAAQAIRRGDVETARDILLGSGDEPGNGWISAAYAVALRTRILDMLAGRGGWGGNLTSGILGSPQGHDCALSAERISEVVREVAEHRAVLAAGSIADYSSSAEYHAEVDRRVRALLGAAK